MVKRCCGWWRVCRPDLARRAAALLLGLLLATPVLAAAPLVLDRDDAAAALAPALTYWRDAGGQTPVDTVEAQAGVLPFAPVRAGQAHLLADAALWLRFDAEVRDPRFRWKLELPMSGVDRITLYFRDAAGAWVVQEAGDTLPMSTWPQPGRYPVLLLSHEAGKTVRYFVRVEHARVPFSALPRIVSDAQLTTSRQADHLLLGVYFGLAALVTVLALTYAVAYRDAGFATYALYIGTFAGSQATFTGAAGLYWWPQWPALNNGTVFLLPLCAAAMAVWFVRTITTPRRFSATLDWLVLALIVVPPTVGLLDALFPTAAGFTLINILISTGMVVLLTVVGVALFEGDRHARWIALGFFPILVSTLFPLLRNFGVLPSNFLTQNALLLGSAIEAPILFYGLLRRVTAQHESTARAITLRTTDPLTGLGSTKQLLAKLRQALSTAERYQQPCALFVIHLRNLSALQMRHGRETGDRAMVMSASRIRLAAQATDTVARVGDSHFALLMEGPMSVEAVTQVATKIVASGLRPSSQLPEADPLQFHVAIGYIDQPARLAAAKPAETLDRMMREVGDMNDGSRKAIRVVQL